MIGQNTITLIFIHSIFFRFTKLYFAFCHSVTYVHFSKQCHVRKYCLSLFLFKIINFHGCKNGSILHMSRVMRKTAFLFAQKKAQISCTVTVQLHSNHAADQRLCFCNVDRTIPLLPKSKISRLQPSSMVLQPGLYQSLRPCWKPRWQVF